ncbi:hypothetical protein G7Y79_00049g084560 [Physcia stellaris]|nr:hypothetical protein G7Y79_00049g084560 [Physcia stellaris]
MEIRRIGEGVLRCLDAPLLPFLAPSLKTRTHLSNRQTPRRPFTVSTSLSDDRSPPPQRSSNDSFAASINKNPQITDVLDNVFGYKGSLGPQKSRLSSDDQVKKSYEEDIYRRENESRASRQGSISGSMILPNDTSPGSTRRASNAVSAQQKFPAPRNTATIKSRPSLGRTVNVTTAGVARALQVLAREVRDNNVRADQKRQRFHERAGLKRKRLKSERWRKRFQIAFRATVQKVQEMRRKGW